MAAPNISTLPTAPQTTQAPDTFAANADAFVAALATMVSEMNALGDWMDALDAIGTVQNFLGAYSAGTSYSIGESVISGGLFYMSLVNSNQGNTPASSPSQWVQVSKSVYELKAQEFTTSGTFTVPAGIVGRVVWCYATGAGGGGGGGNTGANEAGGGGGAGGACSGYSFIVPVSQNSFSVTIGAKGSGAAPSAQGGNGGSTQLGGWLTLNGGMGGAAGGAGGAAGGDGGACEDIAGKTANGSAANEYLVAVGGASGGGGGSQTPRPGGNCRAYGGGASDGASGGGGASIFGGGGDGGDSTVSPPVAAQNADSYGGGGGGGYDDSPTAGTGGDGGDGYAKIYYIELRYE